MPAPRLSKLDWLALACLTLTPALAKNSKPIVPQYILNAHTVAVIVDPGAGVSLSDPNANQTAQRDVETALLKWGRFTTVIDPLDADLVIVLRKGHTKVADVTVSDPRQNSRPGSVTTSDGSIAIGAPHGTPPPGIPGAPAPQEGSTTARPRPEIGSTEDSFQVFEGRKNIAASDAPGWRWIQKNALHSRDVPAVDEFRKAIEDALKQAAQQPGKHP